MALKPIPYEQASSAKIPDKPAKKVKTNKKLNNRVRKANAQDSASHSEKVLKKTCSKILSYLESTGTKSIPKINELEKLLHRSILNLHKQKQSIAKKNKRKN